MKQIVKTSLYVVGGLLIAGTAGNADVNPNAPMIEFVDVMPGEKSHDGGEYGFYTELRPTRFTNVFQVWTSTSCDFDDCGTGFEGYAYLTRGDLDKMRYESDKIIVAGSQY